MGGAFPRSTLLEKNVQTARWGLNRADTLFGGRKIIVQITFWFIAQLGHLTRETILQNGLQSIDKFLCACAFYFRVEVLESKLVVTLCGRLYETEDGPLRSAASQRIVVYHFRFRRALCLLCSEKCSRFLSSKSTGHCAPNSKRVNATLFYHVNFPRFPSTLSIEGAVAV